MSSASRQSRCGGSSAFFHMVEQYVQGLDTLKLFSHLGMNSFANFQ